MKKKNEVKRILSLEKFKIAELKNLRVIVGGDGNTGGTAGGNKIPPVQV
ncbi:hypothetical protein KHA90_21100 [Flavobacterium psychroterrae]|uniref:Bacteriocin n=1 Tax=Flavobacterium psychroterrae TaxID=2133767 RepID=A0ABS5PI58_9FLAO|nr:hypothetical protein [Flavobacterium psychroterrae]MBS7233515.1 hypothetical protein [Flavobacterium psychroterrae]